MLSDRRGRFFLLLSAFFAAASASWLAAGDTCSTLPTRLCLGEGDRFSLQVEFRNFAGNASSQAPADAQGQGQAVEHDVDSGFFWFLDEQSLSLIARVIDGRNINGHFWVFIATTSNFEFEVTVHDGETGEEVNYFNPPGRFVTVADTRAFESPPPEPGLSSSLLHKGPVASEAAEIGLPFQGRLRTTQAIRAAAFPNRPEKNTVPAFPLPLVEPLGTACAPDLSTLCLLDGRFQVRANFSIPSSIEGAAAAQAMSDRSGALAFLGEGRLEILVRVEDGRSANGNFWFFFGSLTDASYEISVVDTHTGRSRLFSNANLESQSFGSNGLFSPPVHLAQFGGGAGFSTRLTLFNLSPDQPAQVDLQLFDPNGQRLLTAPPEASLLPLDEGLDIPPGGSMTLASSPEGDNLFLGSLTAISDQPLGGQARYALAPGSAAVDGGQVLKQARVPVRQSAQQGIGTGLALRNTRLANVSVRLTAFDAEGNPVPAAETVVVLLPNQRLSQFISELFELPDEFEGTVQIETEVHALAVIALELGSASGDFTSISPVPLP